MFSVDAGKIDELEIKSEAGERTTLQRKGSDWTIVQPAPAPTDQATVSGITSNLASMEIQRVIDENPGDVAEFGLATPRVEVAFKAGGQQHRLQIGQKTPAGTDVYARLADQKRVFLVSSFLEGTFNKSSFDLRDKSVLKLDREKDRFAWRSRRPATRCGSRSRMANGTSRPRSMPAPNSVRWTGSSRGLPACR